MFVLKVEVMLMGTHVSLAGGLYSSDAYYSAAERSCRMSLDVFIKKYMPKIIKIK